ncbi:SusC/RagA family TonB-linked outer membrane protein [Maribacter chungangensis]|uniref:SusC/RagA family TonB-linked outer membrane protein n=1 Tax=Maribacter chungangensis TaxID=1069117 RepID=A0ABW3B0I5_9FLAO
MRTKTRGILTLLLAFVVHLSFAQEKTVNGTVTDQNNMPLPGVSVVIVGTTKGTQTDFDGNYAISVATGQQLRYSYIGQKSVTLTIGASNTVNVQMEDDAETLAEVVIMGYRTSTKEKSSIASQTIASETIENRPNANALQTLAGQVAGVNILASTGQPGAPPSVNIRGQASINGNTEPLYVIDDVPTDAGVFRTLNPNDIASVSVLKDAGATAIYGNRGANGVILIKTRQGNFNEGLKISYAGLLGVSTLQGNNYDLMSSPEQLRLENLVGRGRGAGLTDAEIANTPTTDWADYFFSSSVAQNHTVTLTSGSEDVSQFTSFGYSNIDGILLNSDLQRFNIRNNTNGKSKNEKFRYGVSLGINFAKSNEPNNIGGSGINRNPILGAFQAAPYISPDDYVDGASLLSPLSFVNTPLFLIDVQKNNYRRENELQLLGSLNLSYELAKGLTAKVVMSGDYRDETRTQSERPESFNALLFAQGKDPSGTQNQDVIRQFTYNQTTSLNYNTEFGKHSLNVGAFMEYFKAHFQTFGYTQQGLNPLTFAPGDGSAFIGDNPDNDFYVDTVRANILDAGLFSYFGAADYDYDGIYGVSATLRRDASYRFSDTNRWGTFYSASGRINFHNMDFMEGSVFNQLKLRGSYGTTGNQYISQDFGTPGIYFDSPDLTKDLYATGSGYGAANSLLLNRIGNNQLTWETTAQANVGIDFEVFDRRLRGSVDAYVRTTTDLFLDTPISAINAQTNLSRNTGELVNRGFEFNANYDVVRGGNDGFNLTLNAVGAFNEQEIIDLPTEDGIIDISGAPLGYREGGSIFEYYTYRYNGVNPENGNLQFLTADGTVTEQPNVDTDRVWFSQNIFPEFQGSFGFNADYKGFFVVTQFNYAVGLDRFDYDLAGFQNPTNIGQFRHSRDLQRAWTPDNTNTDIPSLDATNFGLSFDSSRYLRSADFLRLRFAQFGYNFPTKLLNGTGLTNLKLFFNGENILTFSDWRGFDPEVNNPTDVTQFRLYPTPKTYSFGIQVGF